MRILQGLGISPGIAAGPVHHHDSEMIHVPETRCAEPAEEFSRFNSVLSAAEKQYRELLRNGGSQLPQEISAIFDAQALFLQDGELLARVRSLIQNHQYTADYAWYKATNEFRDLLLSSPVDIFAERAADLADSQQLVLRVFYGKKPSVRLSKPSIILAEDLTPSELISFDRHLALGFCLGHGSPTSHAAILAKSLAKPAVSGISARPYLPDATHEIILDGGSGTVIIDPDPPTREMYFLRSKTVSQDLHNMLKNAKAPALTKTGRLIAVQANIGAQADIGPSLELGADGIGLLRTEFLFLGRQTAPSEEEQYQVYRRILRGFTGKPVIARTIDVGADKPLPYLPRMAEANPVLGVRGIRLSLQHETIFRDQLLALLRAGSETDLKIMFPFVSTLDEARQAIAQVNACRSILEKRNQPYNPKLQLGLMIETPAAALTLDLLLPHFDFCSIGTNDLVQYTLAADRTNPLVAQYADALDPSILRLISIVIHTAHELGKPVGLCGELAADPAAVPVLLGLHLDSFSMSPHSIPLIKEKIRAISLREAEETARQVLTFDSASATRRFLLTRGYV